MLVRGPSVEWASGGRSGRTQDSFRAPSPPAQWHTDVHPEAPPQQGPIERPDPPEAGLETRRRGEGSRSPSRRQHLEIRKGRISYRLGGRGVELLLQPVRGSLDLLVTPLSGPVEAGDQGASVKAPEVTVDERVSKSLPINRAFVCRAPSPRQLGQGERRESATDMRLDGDEVAPGRRRR